VISQV